MPVAPWIAVVAAAAAAYAQSASSEGRRVVPCDDAQLALHGVSVAGSGERSLVRWRECELPLAVPRESVAVGMLDDAMLVVLAGGIRVSLDLYLIEASGAITRHATD